MQIYEELNRRNVPRVAIAYALGAWVLLQIVDFTTQVIAAPDWILQLLTLLAALGLPIVIIIAWVFEMTPEGIKRESEINRNDSVTSDTGRKLSRLIVIFLALAVIFLLSDKFLLEKNQSRQPDRQATTIPAPEAEPEPIATPDEPAQAEEQSIAVLPFVNMSADPDQEFFSDGISEEILNVLTHIPNLKVAARTSSFQFKGKNLDIGDIGRQLQVAHLLEGSVRTAGGRVRVTAQLVQVADGFHLWSRTFDRQLEDVFAIQDEIANAIASELQATFTTNTPPSATPVDLGAYEHFLKGRGLVAARGEDNLLQAIADLEVALVIEPGYASAMASLSEAFAVLPWYSQSMPSGKARLIARDWAEKALEIEPNDVDAMSVLGLIYFQVDMNWDGARELLTRALVIGPGNITANNFYGDFLLRTCDLEQALVYESRAAELDPLAAVQWADVGNVYSVGDQPIKALEYIQRALELDPNFGPALGNKVRSHFFLGDLDGMEKVLQSARTLGRLPASFVQTFDLWTTTARGELEKAHDMLNEDVAQIRHSQLSSSRVINDAVLLGEFDLAGELLLEAIASGDGTWQFPGLVRLPEQAPDSEPWQEFWRQPGVAELAEIRRSHGYSPHLPGFGELDERGSE